MRPVSDASSRTRLLLGDEGVERLKGSYVLVLGAGGVGSHCIEALARGGIGSLGIVDGDRVAVTNLNRQCIALHSTLGREKALVMKERILDINPRAQVTADCRFLKAGDIPELFAKRPDYVIDAVDTVSVKVAAAVEAERRGIPIVSCMGTGNKLDPSAFQFADIYETSVCPLCRVMRRELKKRGVSSLTVLYSREEPIKPREGGETKGNTGRPAPGSVSFVPPAAGLLLAGYVIRAIAEKTERR